MFNFFKRWNAHKKPKKPQLTERQKRMIGLQNAAMKQKWYTGPADGNETGKWKSAVSRFKRRKGLKPRYYIGPITEDFILNGAPAPKNAPKIADAPWTKMAKSFIGEREIKGPLHNPKILKFWEDIGASWFKDDETPWCGGFMGAMLVRTGFKIPGGGRAARARSFSESPELFKKVPGYVKDGIIVFERGGKNSRSGHVGILLGVDKRGRLMVLGANQQDAVNVKPFPRKRVIGVYLPKGYAIPKGKLPILNSTGMRTSTNEA